MLRGIERKSADTILVTELSRLSRSMHDFCVLWDFLKSHKAQFLSLREQFDTTTAAGEMMMFSIMNFAQFERKQTAERISANFQARALRGLYNGGAAPLGFDPDPNKKGSLRVNAEEAKQVQRIFEVYRETGSLKVTLDTIFIEGIRTKKRIRKSDGKLVGGRPFCLNSLINLLRNRHYIAEREINKKNRFDKEGDGKSYQTAQASWPAVVSRELFFAVQEQMDLKLAKYREAGRDTFDYLYSALVRCPDCGKAMVGISGTGKKGEKYKYYAHKGKANGCAIHSVDAENVQKVIRTRFKQLAENPEFLTHLYREAELNQKALQPDQERTMAGIQNRLKELDKKKRAVLNLIEEYDGKLIKEELKAVETEMEQLSAQLEFLKDQRAFAKNNVVDAKEHFDCVKTLDRNFSKLSPAKQRQFVKLFIGRIEIFPDKAVIRYNYDRTSFEKAADVLRTGTDSNSHEDGPSGPSFSSNFSRGLMRTGCSYQLKDGGYGTDPKIVRVSALLNSCVPKVCQLSVTSSHVNQVL